MDDPSTLLFLRLWPICAICFEDYDCRIDGDRLRGDQAVVEVLVVEPFRAFRQAIALAVEGCPGMCVVGQVRGRAEAIPYLGRADVALIDPILADDPDLQLIADYKEANRRGRVVILAVGARTAAVDPVFAARNVVGYVDSERDMADLIDAISRAAGGQAVLSIAEIVEGSPQSEADSPLTKRELEVLRCLCEGLSGPEVAGRLHISHHTERRHVANILKKLRARSRVQAVAIAITTQLLDILPSLDISAALLW